MQKVKFINSKGELIDLTDGSDFGIVNISGLSEVDLNIQTQQVPFQDGSVFLDSLLQDRVVAITLAINDEKNLEKRYKLKRQLIKILNPKLGEGTLIYENDFIKKQIKCISQVPLFPNKNSDEGGTLKASLSFDCPSPYWEDIDEVSSSFKFTKRGYFENEGDVPTDVNLEITTDGVKNPTIKNFTTGKQIKLLGEFNENINIDTHSGEKSIYTKSEKFNMFSNSITFYSVAYSEKLNLFVAVGDKGLILTSNDGANWTGRSSGISGELNSIIYSEKLNLFVIACWGKIILTSNDGIIWTKIDLSSKLWNDIEFLSVVYSEKLNLFVASGDTGSIVTSNDGVNWTKSSNGASRGLLSIIYSEKLNLFVGVGYEGTISTSSDGINWTGRSSGISESLQSIIYSEKLNLFVAVGENGKILTSPDGVNWTSRNTTISKNFSSVVYSEKLNLFVTVTYDGITVTSNDGINWTVSEINNSFIRKIVYFENINLFVSFSKKILTSSDGINWIDRWSYSVNELSNVVRSERLNLFVTVSKNSNSIFISNDGITWSEIELELASNQNISHISYSEKLNLFVAVGNYLTMTSNNGIDWDVRRIEYFDFTSIVYSEKLNLFVASTLHRTILTSSDGVNWTDKIIEDVPSGKYLNLLNYIEELNLFMVTTTEYNLIIISDDGVNWTGRSINADLYSITYSEKLNLFVATQRPGIGVGTLWTSDDGINWTIRSFGDKLVTSLNYVIYSEKLNMFLSVGNSGILLMSDDGINWIVKDILGGSMNNIFITNDKRMMITGKISVYSNIEKVENLIDKLSEDSDMTFNLIQGNNELALIYDDGYALATIKFKNKYIGV